MTIENDESYSADCLLYKPRLILYKARLIAIVLCKPRPISPVQTDLILMATRPYSKRRKWHKFA